MWMVLTVQVLQLVAQLLQLWFATAKTATTATTPGMAFCEPPPGAMDAAGKVWTSKTGSVVHARLNCSHIANSSNLRVQQYTFCKDCASHLVVARAAREGARVEKACPRDHRD